MKQRLLAFALLCTSSTVAAWQTSSQSRSYHHREKSLLFAVPPQKQQPRHSKTSCEGAVMVEWEQLSELERRVEDGARYEHWPESSQFLHQKEGGVEEMSVHKGVFAGYRVSKEEYQRLKSADPNDPLDI